MNKTMTFVCAAGFLLSIVGCGSSEPSSPDTSISHDAQPGLDAVVATGGTTATGGVAGGTGGAIDGGGSGHPSGGATGAGGMMSTGGQTTGTGGQATGTGGAAIDAGTGTGGIDGSSTDVCGGIAALACPKGEFCEYPSGTCSGIADGTGICATPSQVCPTIYQPVCGCDGKTYGNDCERRGAGVSKRADGECSTMGKMCGGIAGIACPKDQFCDLAAGDCGSIADGAGTCAPTGAGVACNKIYQPVCGCDGKTYGNDCERQVAGVSKRADGECSTMGKMCGGIAGLACSKGQFCDLARGDCGRIADGAGTCARTGNDIGCPAVYQPVCGCDGKTYGNDCERQVAGVSKSSDGACPIVDGGTAG